MRLLFLAVLRRHTGNAVTAERVRDHLEAAGHVCLLKDAFDLESSSEVAHLIRAENLEAALALHLYRGGRLLQGHGIPFGIIFGGTDLNEDVKQREKNEVMGRVLGEARFAVAFTESMKETAQTQWCVHVLIKILLEIKMQKARQISRAVPCAAGGTDPWELKSFNVTQRMETSSVPEPRRPPSQDHDLRAQTSGMTRNASNSSNHQSTEWQGELFNNINNPQPHARDKIYIQSQGVMTVPNAAFNWNTFLHRSGINQSADNLHIFLLVCGLRQVKDPLYLVDAFSEWHREEPNVYMVIVGPELASLGDVKLNSCGRQIRKSLMQYNLYAIRSTTLKYNPAVFSIFMQFADVTLVRVDPVFTREVKAKVKRTAGVRLLGEMPQGDLHAALRNCFAVVNSSMSEGMSAAILEAMDLEVPVLARNIPGNAAVVKHEVTGLLFSDPQDFVQLAKRLVREPALEKELVANGREYVRRYHSWQAERDTYQNLVRTLEGSTGE